MLAANSRARGRALVLLAGAIGAAALSRELLSTRTPPIRRRSRSPGSRSVATLTRVRIGDTEQWVLERSENLDNPILIFLHGGPGTSQLTLNRRNTRRLEHDFIVVNWDQRGAGKSYRAMQDTGKMTVEQVVEDTRELVGYLLAKYGKQRVVLVGHSWGSVVGALTAAKYPELVSCYVGIGQVTKMVDGEKGSYAWTLDQARARRNRRAVQRLAAMGNPPYPGDWQRSTITQRGYLARFGGEVHGNPLGAIPLVLSGLIFSPEYTGMDRVNVFRGISDSMRVLWPQLMTIDLFEMVPELKVPVVLVEGRHDHEVPSALSATWFQSLTAPLKELVWFEHSAHMPNFEQRDLFNELMIQRVRPLAMSNRPTRSRQSLPRESESGGGSNFYL